MKKEKMKKKKKKPVKSIKFFTVYLKDLKVAVCKETGQELIGLALNLNYLKKLNADVLFVNLTPLLVNKTPKYIG